MAVLVVYDTGFGNTARLAKDMAAAIPGASALSFDGIDPGRLPAADLVIVGSPTHGGRPTPALQSWLSRLPIASLENRKVAAFDTRLPAAEQGFALRVLMRLIGFAAPRIAKALRSKRAILVAEPEGFLVDGREGPLRAGELERAARWAAALAGTSHA